MAGGSEDTGVMPGRTPLRAPTLEPEEESFMPAVSPREEGREASVQPEAPAQDNSAR